MRSFALVVAVASTSFLVAREAVACGGFFRETVEAETVTLEQSATRILFEVDDLSVNPSVTAHVQVGTQGNPSEFAWVIPVPAQPFDLGVSTVALFEQLDRATAPRLAVVTEEEEVGGGGCGCGLGDSKGGDTSEDVQRAGPVIVWSHENVGPYETTVVSSDDPAALTDWLVGGGFEVPAVAGPIIAAYVSSNSYFLAMKLRQDAAVSEIQPIHFTYNGEEPCVPLRMDSISAADDQPILAWVFADGPAVPANWVQTALDFEQLIFGDGTTNYIDLVKAAVDASGGQAFVREYAAETQYLDSPSEYFGEITLTDPTLLDLQARHAWVTRLFTIASPAEMTIDPTFQIDENAGPVSNEYVRYASAWSPTDSAAACLVTAFGFGLRHRRRRHAG